MAHVLSEDLRKWLRSTRERQRCRASLQLRTQGGLTDKCAPTSSEAGLAVVWAHASRRHYTIYWAVAPPPESKTRKRATASGMGPWARIPTAFVLFTVHFFVCVLAFEVLEYCVVGCLLAMVVCRRARVGILRLGKFLLPVNARGRSCCGLRARQGLAAQHSSCVLFIGGR